MKSEIVLKGVAASPGIAVGKAFIYDKEDFWIEERTISEHEVDNEVERFLAAVGQVRDEIKETQERLKFKLGKEQARILDAHRMMLEDQVVIDETVTRIREERKNAAFSFFRTLRKVIKALKPLEDNYLKEKLADIRDIGRRVFFRLYGKEHPTLRDLEFPAVIVSHALSPFDVTHMQRGNVLAFVTDIGGRTSHVAIIARAMEIPAVVGLETASSQISADDMLVVDGNRGIVYVNPNEATLEQYQQERKRLLQQEEVLKELWGLPAITQDGKKVDISANIELPEEVEKALSHGAQGIGLFRTEFLYLLGGTPPSEDEQFGIYREIAEKIAPYPTIIRTLDLGGDKLPGIAPPVPEANPFLGWRAIRVSLALKDLFKVQLRAILRASVVGNIQVMFPMISGLEELVEAKGVLEEVKEELRQKKIPFDEQIKVGAMIEVPAAVMVAEYLAGEVDFFSLGTNDLIQYAVAVDRGNEKISYLFDPLHPGVLRLIKLTIDAGHRRGIWVGMCGEMSADPLATVPLLGLGLDEFSMSPLVLPQIKNIIRSVTFKEAQAVAEEILQMKTAREIRKFLQQVMDRKFCDISIAPSKTRSEF
ncbi:MAG: phosphoenolpyruvate--protein phosphotransferase [Candidatus Latescibacteria bacterium]|nr:phosphoenolpyruvate--protein phosphotransferase [Candidatus Latescibacterota bacterium]